MFLKGLNYKFGLKVISLLLLLFVFGCRSYYSADDFDSVPKIDAHIHINAENTELFDLAKSINFRFITINVDNNLWSVSEQRQTSIKIREQFADRFAYTTAFDTSTFLEPGWVENTIAFLDESFENGACAVKLWKNIGMRYRDGDGKFLMADDVRLKPVLDYIESRHITICTHLGEPRACWLPLEEIKMPNNKRYYAKKPHFHMYKHPEYPSYEQQITAMKNLYSQHRDTRFVGMHLASLEWSVEEVAKLLDEYPNVAVDISARIGNLHLQASEDRQKVRDFFIKYQDRILYGVDFVPGSGDKFYPEYHLKAWQDDFNFLATDQEKASRVCGAVYRGLKLDKSVVDKILYENARKWYDVF
jgi:predicted TIM-barrel fold metal-dependent hydrolase